MEINIRNQFLLKVYLNQFWKYWAMIIPGNQHISAYQEETCEEDKCKDPLTGPANAMNIAEREIASMISKKNPVEKTTDFSFSDSVSFKYLTVAESIPKITSAAIKTPVGKSIFQSATVCLSRLFTTNGILINCTRLYSIFPAP